MTLALAACGGSGGGATGGGGGASGQGGSLGTAGGGGQGGATTVTTATATTTTTATTSAQSSTTATTASATSGGGQGGASATSSTSSALSSTASSASSTTATTSASASSSTSTGGSSGSSCGTCPSGYTCGTANGLPVCRAPSGVPLFSHVFVIVMENTSLATLNSAMAGGHAFNLTSYASTYATGANYHGVTHPSLPNYIALTSGDPQGIGCDCKAASGQGSCNIFTCNLALSSCSCDKNVAHLGDQLEAAGKTWMAFGEDMGTPCNLTDANNYAVRHVPFLYYDNVQGNAARCKAHAVDFSSFNAAAPATFNFIAPNLVDDMHNPPIIGGTQNITNGDTWLGPHVSSILQSTAYTQGGLVVVVWDEDDDSGGISGSDDPIGIFVLSRFAKNGGYISQAKADHYSLLATIEDGLDLPRLGNAGKTRTGVADTLSDYFPAN